MIFNSTNELSPASAIAKAIYMIQAFLVVVLTAIFTSILIFVRKERETEELNLAATGLTAEGLAVEKAILDGYGVVSVEAALLELQKLKGNFVRFIYLISSDVK